MNPNTSLNVIDLLLNAKLSLYEHIKKDIISIKYNLKLIDTQIPVKYQLKYQFVIPILGLRYR